MNEEFHAVIEYARCGKAWDGKLIRPYIEEEDKEKDDA